MRSRPSSWTTTLAKLGFRRQRRKLKQRTEYGRKSRIESLEPRQMLTVTVDTLMDVVDSGDGVTSLREAIAHPTDHTVAIAASLHGGRIVLRGRAKH